MSGWEGRPTRPVPRLGEHSVEILRAAGIDAARIGKLVRGGIVLDGARRD